jgi:purine nucleoside phosphorylase
VVANPAAGIGDDAITMEAIQATLDAAMQKVRTLVETICERL